MHDQFCDAQQIRFDQHSISHSCKERRDGRRDRVVTRGAARHNESLDESHDERRGQSCYERRDK